MRFRDSSATGTDAGPNVLERLSPAIAANRFGLGAKPGELDQIGSQPGLAVRAARRCRSAADGTLSFTAPRRHWRVAWTCGASYALPSVRPLRHV